MILPVKHFTAIAAAGTVLFGGFMFGWAQYKVWQQNKVGEAELARAEQNRQIAIQEAKAKFLANFKMDRNNKFVRHRATDPASLQPTPDIPNVSNTNELQSLRNYVEEQREQMQNIIGGMQSDFKRLVRAFDKSSIANFPSHEVELGDNTRNTSVKGCHDQSQPLYGMPIDMYLGQQ